MPTDSGRKLKFARGDRFQIELKRRVDDYFRATGKRRRDCPRLYAKMAILLTSLAATYGLLVFAAATWWQALPLAILLGCITAAIGMNVQHDGGHQAVSDRSRDPEDPRPRRHGLAHAAAAPQIGRAHV